jgi:hypothetical protein
MSGIPFALVRSNVPDCDQDSRHQMDVKSRNMVDRETHPALEDGDQISVLGGCQGFAVVPAGQARDFYRGYALVAVPAMAMAAVVGIAYFVFGLSF